MILSASRRTDIPTFYSEWFMNRIKEGFFYVRNPMNIRQVSRIDISPELVDCIVFWTKNPIPMLPKLDQLRDYCYYFQFTLTGYGKDIEKNLPDKKADLIITQKVSNVSRKMHEITLLARLLAAQKHPIGIYFISEDIFTLASYYQDDLRDTFFLPGPEVEMLPDEID